MCQKGRVCGALDSQRQIQFNGGMTSSRPWGALSIFGAFALVFAGGGCKQSIPASSAPAPAGNVGATGPGLELPPALPLPTASPAGVASAAPLGTPAAGPVKKEYFPTKRDQGICERAGGGVGAFGASRGVRKHAGCDVYNPVGTHIYAVADGTVISDSYLFACSTYAIEVDHGSYIVRYGEFQRRSETVRRGQKVTAGQLLAKVGDLDCTPQNMLHFEMYSGKATGPLSGGSSPYRRRSDLLDPTAWLKARHAQKPP